jgi:hypothetical protein
MIRSNLPWDIDQMRSHGQPTAGSMENLVCFPRSTIRRHRLELALLFQNVISSSLCVVGVCKSTRELVDSAHGRKTTLRRSYTEFSKSDVIFSHGRTRFLSNFAFGDYMCLFLLLKYQTIKRLVDGFMLEL